MGIDDIKNLIREVSQADIDTFEYEENNTRVYISKNSGGNNVSENISTEKNITKTDIADNFPTGRNCIFSTGGK